MNSRVMMLAVASQAAMSDLESAWRERRLCDDLPALVHAREHDMPADLRNAICEGQAKGSTGWFDTHPCAVDRIQRVKQMASSGVFNIDAPATILFRNFNDLARRSTVAFYHAALG